MSDGINGKIGEEGQAPLLVIADEGDDPAPALAAIEETPLPAPAVEALDAKREASTPVAKTKSAAPSPSPSATPAAANVAPASEPLTLAASPASAPLPQPQAEVEPAPLAAGVVKSKRSPLRFVPLAAVSMAVFASSLSVIGLLVASRTLAETKIVLDQVQAHQAKMRHLDTVIDKVEALRYREQIALVRLERINAGKPATGAEVRAAIAGLQLAMAKYQPDNLNSTLTNIRDGQYELAERVSTMYRRVEKIDEQMAKLPVSSSPKGKSAVGRAPTS